MQNPLDAEITLSNVTVVVQENSGSESSPIDEFVEVEVITEVSIGPKASCSVSSPVFHRCAQCRCGRRSQFRSSQSDPPN